MENNTQLALPTLAFNPIADPQPESRAFSNIKFYNHLVEHFKKDKFCGIDCMAREFEGRSTESNRKQMRQRLTVFRRWCRDEQGKFIVVIDDNNGHREALAAKIYDPLNASQRDRELMAADVNRWLHRKEISEETYNRIFELVYPMLNEEQKSE
jgi:hypothetical protein